MIIYNIFNTVKGVWSYSTEKEIFKDFTKGVIRLGFVTGR